MLGKRGEDSLQSYINQENGIFPSVCSLDCPDQCGLLVHKKDGKIVKIEGDPSHPVKKYVRRRSVCHLMRGSTTPSFRS